MAPCCGPITWLMAEEYGMHALSMEESSQRTLTCRGGRPVSMELGSVL